MNKQNCCLDICKGRSDSIKYTFSPTSINKNFVTGDIKFSDHISPQNIETPDFIRVIDINLNKKTITIQLGRGEKTQGEISIRCDRKMLFIPLPSAPVYYAAVEFQRGNGTEGLSVVHDTYSDFWAWSFRSDCKNSIEFEYFVKILNNAAAVSNSFDHVQFRSCLTYFAKRIFDDSIHSIQSFGDLKNKIKMWNSAPNLRKVNVSDVLCEYLGREWYRGELDSERETLRRLGVCPESFDPEWETPFPACWIAHVALTEGIEATRKYVSSRPSPRDDSHDQLQDAAYDAGFNERGQAWGAVVAESLSEADDTYKYDLYHYLRWTAEDTREKQKYQPILYGAAYAVAPQHLSPHLFQRVEFEEQIEIGQNWRRDSETDNEIIAFERAKNIAVGTDGQYEFNPELVIEAVGSLTHAKAKKKKKNSISSAVDQYESGIQEIKNIANSHDLDAKDQIKFLTEQKSRIAE